MATVSARRERAGVSAQIPLDSRGSHRSAGRARALRCPLDMQAQALALSFLLGSLSALAIGCGCGAGSTYTQPAGFTPSKVTAARNVMACEIPNAQFAGSDALSLDLLGSTSVAPPFTEVRIGLTPTTPVRTSIPLNVDDASPGAGTQTASYTSYGVRFELVSGSNPSEIDGTGLVAVVVEVLSMPATDGDPLSIDLLMTFADGRELHDSYQASVTTVSRECPLDTPVVR